VQIALYRIAQEALNNVLKHSAASVAVLGLYCENEQATMRIHDNGVGFDQNSPVDGLGLHNMRERADQIHATFVLESTPDSGTEITVVWRERS
jgi:signal transduction histidine kinase